VSEADSVGLGLTFDLGSARRALQAELRYQRDGQAARTLVRRPDLRVVLVVLRRGSRIAEHHASEAVSIHTIAGHLRLHLPASVIDLETGQLLVLAPGLHHDVEAPVDSAFILTLGAPAHLQNTSRP
jgi:quercetin dioxygenase-like cupin family protein